MRKYTAFYQDCDKILKALNEREHKAIEFSAAVCDEIGIDYSNSNRCITQLSNDELTEGNMFMVALMPKGEGFSYKIFFEEENKRMEDEGLKFWYESENARVQFEDYPVTKKNASVAILLSGISVLIAILSMMLSQCK
jgi:hypothetical protein